jgi:hypothetical protein
MSESDHPNELLTPPKGREQALEQWLREEVVPAYQQLKAAPSSGLSVDAVRAALAQRRPKPL